MFNMEERRAKTAKRTKIGGRKFYRKIKMEERENKKRSWSGKITFKRPNICLEEFLALSPKLKHFLLN